MALLLRCIRGHGSKIRPAALRANHGYAKKTEFAQFGRLESLGGH